MLICPNCSRTIDIALQKKVGPHLGLYCPYCGRWLKWQKQHNSLPDDIVNNLPDDIVNNLPDNIVDSMPSSFSQLPDDIVNNLPDDIVNNLPDDMPPWEV